MKTAERKPASPGEPAATTPPKEPAAGAGTFTRYVRAIAARSEAVGEMAEELVADLRRTLVREMKKRSLWASSPSYVGVLGCPTWTLGDPAGTSAPLDELVADCYLQVFGRQLRQLLNQLKVNSKIDGLVVFYVRGFLTSRQKLHDPLGYRLFEILCTAVRDAVAAGELHVVRGTPSIRNQTVLGAAPDADPDTAAPIADLRPLVALWNDDLLPGLVTAERAARREVIGSLRRRLPELDAEGVAAFCFKDLLDALKDDVRARWTGLSRHEDGETAVEEDDEGVRLVRIFRPETRVEDDESFQKLVRCVANLIEKLDGQKKTRQKTRLYLETLWNFLRRYAMGLKQENLPSNRELAEELDIPRERFAGLYETLGQLTSRCKGELSGAVVEIDAGRHRPGTSAGGRDG